MRLPGVVFALAAGLMSVGFDICQIRREKRLLDSHILVT
jgi:hypothetical protein